MHAYFVNDAYQMVSFHVIRSPTPIYIDVIFVFNKKEINKKFFPVCSPPLLKHTDAARPSSRHCFAATGGGTQEVHLVSQDSNGGGRMTAEGVRLIP